MDEIIINNLANKINEKEKSSHKTSSWGETTNNIRYPTEKLVKDSLDAKSDSTHTHNSQISYGQVDDTSTSTVFTATVSGVTALTDGTTVMLKNGVVTSASGFTLNVNNLGAKPVYNNMAAASADTTIFNVNYTMLFVYDSTRISDGCWICYRGYNSDNNTIGYQIRTNSTSFTPLDKTYRYRIMLEVENNKLMPVNTSTSTSATASKTSTMNTREFKLGGNIYYYSYSSAINANAYFGTGYIWIQYNFALGYSFNNTNAALVMTAKEPVYMIAEQTSNGMAKLKTPFFTQTLPNTADGLLYILLGYATSEVNLELTLDHPIYEYRDGGIKLYRDTYTKNETDTLLNGKASSSHTHTTSNITDFPTIPSKTSDLTNDSGFLTSHQNISGKEDTSNKVTSLSSSSTDTQYPSAKCVYDTVDIVDDKVSVVYNTVSIINTSDSVYDADRWTEYGGMTIGQAPSYKFISGGAGEGYVIYNGNISNLDNYDITLNLTANKTDTYVYINDNSIGTLPTSQTSILFKKRDGVVKVVYDNNQYNASAVKIIALKPMSIIRYTIDIVLYQGMIYDVIDSIPSKTSDLTNDSGFLTSHQSLANYVTNDDSRLSDSRTPTSHTHGNLQNNGQVGSTAQANKNVVTNGSGLITTEDKPTIPSASSTTPSADTTSGSVGNGTTWARSNHTHPKSSLYAEASHTHTKSEVTDFPTLHTVATSGSYNDLSDKPNIPQGSTVDTTLSGTSNNAIANSTVKNALDNKLDKTHTSYKGKNVVTNSSTGAIEFEEKNNHTHSQYLTEHQSLSNYVTNSDSRLSDARIPLSHSHGNLQNNGQVGSTAQANKNVVTDGNGLITTEDKPTIPSASSTTPSADTTNGSVGTGTTWARSNHTHPKSSLYAESSHTHSQYLTEHQNISGKEDTSNKTSSWNTTTNNTRYPTEKLVKDSLDGKSDTGHTHSQYLTSHQDITGKLDKAQTSYKGKNVVVDSTSGEITFEDKNNHTHSNYLTSHQDISNYVQKSNTSGLIKNDGTIDTTNYSTFDGNYNNLTNKPTIPTQTSQLTNNSGFITSSSVPTIADNLTTNDSTQVLSAKQGKVLNTNKIETSAIATSFSSTTSDSKVPSEKLTKTELDKKITKSNSATGLLKDDGTVDTNSYLTTANASSTYVAKETGKGLFSGSYNDLTNKPSIPSKTSDLTNDSGFLTSHQSLANYVQKSSTTGLLKNDGSVDTSTYLTSHQSLTNYLQKSDVKNNLTSTDTDKPLSANQGKELKTLVDGKQATLVSGTNIKTINSQSLLGSGNIDISGGSCVTDFFIDTNTNEWVIETSACSQGEVVTSWSSTLTDTKVPSEKLVKNYVDGLIGSAISYYRYELTSSNYNPQIDSSITLTVKVTDVFGNPVNNKTVQLYHDGSSLGSSYQLTTDTNGVATATYTVTHFGIHDFSVANQHIQLEVGGWKQYYYDSATNGWYIRILYNETHTKVIINDPANVSFTTTETNYVTDVLTDSWIRPLKPISFFINFQRRLIVREGSANIVKVATTSGTGNIYAQLDWAHQGLP